MLIHLSILTIYAQFTALISRPEHKLVQIVCCAGWWSVAVGVGATGAYVRTRHVSPGVPGRQQSKLLELAERLQPAAAWGDNSLLRLRVGDSEGSPVINTGC